MQIENHKEACQLLSDIKKSPSRYLIIHYSCESFLDIPNGNSPRIASIAIRSLETGQTDSFSIHKIAELKGIAFECIEQHYDELELDMLVEYMEFLSNHHEYCYIHWNMRNANYGFKAIEHRFTVLQRKKNKSIPIQRIPDINKIDLSILLIKKYGDKYIDDPKILKLIEKNQFNPKDFLPGSEEAKAFKFQEFNKLHLSTLSKTVVLERFLSMATDNTLKTNSSWIQTHGYTPQTLWVLSKEKWYAAIIFGFITYAIGKFDTHIINFIRRLLMP